MKLAHVDLEQPIVTNLSCYCEWVIEAPELFSKYVQELLMQQTQKEGNFVLSEADKILDISKVADIIVNPLAVDINDKKVLNKLYLLMNDMAFSEDIYMQTQQIMQCIYEYILDMEQRSDYVLSIDETIDINMLLKAAGVKFEVYEEDFVDTLSRYIQLASKLLHIKLFVFINLRSFLNEKQLTSLIQDAMYQNVELIMIENQQRTCVDNMKSYIIDKDNCFIF